MQSDYQWPLSQTADYAPPNATSATEELDCPLTLDPPVRFLDLPTELQIMVYERGVINIKHHVLQNPVNVNRDTSISLLSRTLPVARLATCRLVQAEASPFLHPKIALLRDSDRFSLIIDQLAYLPFVMPSEILCTIALERKRLLLRGGPMPPPFEFRIQRARIGHTHRAFHDVDDFTRSLATLTTTGFPKTTTIAIRIPENQPQNDTNYFCANVRDNASTRRHLDALMPGQVHFVMRQQSMRKRWRVEGELARVYTLYHTPYSVAKTS